MSVGGASREGRGRYTYSRTLGAVESLSELREVSEGSLKEEKGEEMSVKKGGEKESKSSSPRS